MVYRKELTYGAIVEILDVNYIAGSTNGCILIPCICEITVNNLMLKSLVPNKVQVKTTVDDIRLKSNLNTNRWIRFNKKLFFYTQLGFV